MTDGEEPGRVEADVHASTPVGVAGTLAETDLRRIIRETLVDVLRGTPATRPSDAADPPTLTGDATMGESPELVTNGGALACNG